MASKYLQDFPIPEKFPPVLHDFAREVLRDQPEDIILYAAEYFEALRDGKEFNFESKYNVKPETYADTYYSPKKAQSFDPKNVPDRFPKREAKRQEEEDEMPDLNDPGVQKVTAMMQKTYKLKKGKEGTPRMTPSSSLAKTTIPHSSRTAVGDSKAELKAEEKAILKIQQALDDPVQLSKLKEKAMHDFHEYDADKSGYIEIREFLPLCTQINKAFDLGAPTAQDVFSAMKIFDLNQDGKLSPDEFWNLIHKVLQAMLVKELEANRSNQIKADKTEIREIMNDAAFMKELIESAKQSFKLHDKDGSGTLEAREFYYVLKEINSAFNLPSPNVDDVNNALEFFDKNQDGKIDFEEFVKLMKKILELIADSEIESRHVNKAKAQQEARKVKEYPLTISQMLQDPKEVQKLKNAAQRMFKRYDKDGSGYLDLNEFEEVVKDINADFGMGPPNAAMVNQAMQESDLDGDGKVSPGEYWILVYKILSIRAEEEVRQEQTDTRTLKEKLKDPREIKKFKENSLKAFQRYDVDGSGFLELKEFYSVVYDINRDFGIGTATKEMALEILKSIDLNNDEKVSPAEFWVLTYKMLELAAQQEQSEGTQQQVQRPEKQQGRSQKGEKPAQQKTLQQKLNDPKEIQRLKQNSRIQFNHYDKDKSGYLENKEFFAVIQDINEAFGLGNPSEEMANQAMQEADLDSDGKISPGEFWILTYKVLSMAADIEAQKEEHDRQSELKRKLNDPSEIKKFKENSLKAFQRYDVDGSGYLDVKEFHSVVQDLRRDFQLGSVTTELVQQVMNAIDVNQDGQVSPGEFWILVYHLLHAQAEGKVPEILLQRKSPSSQEPESQNMAQIKKTPQGQEVKEHIERQLHKRIHDPKEIQKLKQQSAIAFKNYDKDGSGKLDINEFVSVVRDINKAFNLGNPDQETIMSAMAESDLDQDGQIDQSEFFILTYKVLSIAAAKERAESPAGSLKATLKNPQELQKLKQGALKAFQRYDTDGSGYLEGREFYVVICDINRDHALPPPSKEQALQILKKFDTDKDGRINVQEFWNLVYQLMQQEAENEGGKQQQMHLIDKLQESSQVEALKQDALKSFKKYDADNSGYLDMKEFVEVIKDIFVILDLGEVDQETVYAAMEETDKNKDGKIDFEEFWALTLKVLEEIANEEAGQAKALRETGPEVAVDLQALLENAKSRKDIENIANETFKKYDKDGSGFLEVGEFIQVVKDVQNFLEIDEELTEEEVIEEMRNYDFNQDGKISLSEYQSLMYDLLKMQAAKYAEQRDYLRGRDYVLRVLGDAEEYQRYKALLKEIFEKYSQGKDVIERTNIHALFDDVKAITRIPFANYAIEFGIQGLGLGEKNEVQFDDITKLSMEVLRTMTKDTDGEVEVEIGEPEVIIEDEN